ncbi:MAG: MaoC family dehydratase [Bdellovibrionales bacterium]|jgi:acyl dehydratase|nr:MaoC family dehydratase [Bdellovibrionales bacterium]
MSERGFKVGDSASVTVTVTDELVRAFADLSGDMNPIHMDDSYARKTRFGKRIAHGAILGSLLSRVAGTKLPGPGTIVISQDIRYKSPCYIGDIATAEIKIIHMRADKPVIKVASRVTNQHGNVLIDGGAILYFDPVE